MVFFKITQIINMATKTISKTLRMPLLNQNYVLRRFCSNKNVMEKYYEIIIAGGGMVGTAMACALARSDKLRNKKILVLEGGPKRTIISKGPNDPYSNRVVSLNPATKKLFESLNVWRHISSARYQTVKKMQVWDSCSEAMITFDHPGLTEDVSYIVENDVILNALSAELDKLGDHIEVKYDSRIKEITLPSESSRAVISLEKENGTYSCDLVIGAEGFNSATRRAMNSQWLTWSYKQSAVVATLKLAETTENIVAWQRFLPTGPIALLPLTNSLSSLVWSTTPEAAKNLVKISDDQFVDAVNDALWKKLPSQPIVDTVTKKVDNALNALSLPTTEVQQLPPSISSVLPSSRASFPLGFGHAAKYVGPSAALIGDSAHRVHPLAGQGVNLGFGDVDCLSRILADAIYSGKKLGSISHLLEYERKRQCHNIPTMIAIDSLQKLYNSTALPIVMLRSLGMQLTNSLKPLKKAIISHASS